jgi:glycosyltransferase involved in cell wall biosynthesis
LALHGTYEDHRRVLVQELPRVNIYHLPGNGIYGGIKVGYQFAALLCDLGVPCMVATPDGQAPQWFKTSVPTVSHHEAFSCLQRDTNILFSYPPDYKELLGTGANLVVHCQGTDDRMDPILANPNVRVITCWPQAYRHVLRLTGRKAVEVGIPISKSFYYDGTDKVAGTVAFMPRRGYELAQTSMQRNPALKFVAIDGVDEKTTAAIMKQCEYYIATSSNEAFGLPAFEAMAAGAVVLSVPVIGGMDFLRDRQNCIVAPPDRFADALLDLAREENARLRANLRQEARITSMNFLESRQRRHVASLLDNELSFLRVGLDQVSR